MFKRFPFLSPAVMFGLCFAAPDGDAGGAPAAAGGSADPATVVAADPNADPAAADPSAVDGGDPEAVAREAAGGDDDDDAAGDDDVAEHLPESAVRNRLRRTQRFATRARPIVERFRDPKTGKWATGDEVDRTLRKARDFDEIESVLTRSPEAVQFLMKERARLDALERGETPAAAAAEDPPFNEEEWPYETDTPQGQRLLALAKSDHENKTLLRKMQQRLDGLGTKDEEREFAQVNETWKAATLAAAEKEVAPEYRNLFIKGVNRLFRELKSQGRLTKANVNAVIDAELADVRAAKKAATRTTTTAASRTVAANANLPRVPRPGQVTPAAAGASTKRETLKDGSSSFFARVRGSQT